MIPACLKTIVRDRVCVEQVRHVCQGHGRGLLLLSDAGYYRHVDTMFAM